MNNYTMEPEHPNAPQTTFGIKAAFERFIQWIRKDKSEPGDRDLEDDLCTLKTWAGLEPSKQEMIRGIINLSRQNVREIMIPRIDVVAVDVEATQKELIDKIYGVGHSRIPVYKETIDNIVGVLHVKDLLKYIVDKPRKFVLKKILRKPYFVPETMPLDDLLREFKKRSLHMAIAVDEYGGFGGIVTLEDILEEIVGDISDEFDTQELPELEKIGRNSYEVDSRMLLTDFSEEMGIALPTDEFDTIGGFVYDLFGKIPEKHETAKYKNLTFKIKDIDGTRINRLVITVVQPEKHGKPHA